MRGTTRLQTCLTIGLLAFANAAWADVSAKRIGTDWQVTAKAEGLKSVTVTLAEQAGFQISGASRLSSNNPITGSWSGSVVGILSRILHDVDYVTETGTDKFGEQRILRLVILSGTIGQMPAFRGPIIARRVPQKPSAKQLASTRSDGNQVAALLATKTGMAGQKSGQTDEDTKPNRRPGIKRNADGTYEISPETRTRISQANRRAQSDLQALVNSLQNQRRENNARTE
ncbi:MAG: hypothetical protein COA47_09275 [Robiginitomaculum sp.]|nr:MAG: hypothetical protein COA47_09275 [Robiginitomaculum sp.]